jgi:SM-20-related protein
MNAIFEQIADGLAGQGYAIVDDFLSKEEVKAIHGSETFPRDIFEFKKAGIGKTTSLQINESVRGDFIRWVDRTTAPYPVQVYLERLEALIPFLNQSLYLSLKDFEVHLTMYPVGTFYKRHLDQFRADDHRKLSVICYLNEDWMQEHGGQLRMYFPDESKDVLPLAGRLVCFRSDQIEHEVLPASRTRLSITGWILDQLADLRVLN